MAILVLSQNIFRNGATVEGEIYDYCEVDLYDIRRVSLSQAANNAIFQGISR